MPVSDVLKNFRGSDYGAGEKGDKPSEKSEGTSSRTIELSPEEAKSLGGAEPGAEVTLQVTGRLEDTHFHIMSVQGQGGESDTNADAEAVMSKMRGPMTPMQTMPSPS